MDIGLWICYDMGMNTLTDTLTEKVALAIRNAEAEANGIKLVSSLDELLVPEYYVALAEAAVEAVREEEQ